ncbi:polyprenyl synthetase family protein [Sporomusa acidovorans]|uniref:Farnesyl diphosphate synthase n=1 Tax=Sporomusa acidovorans (strain ATCC 49682 / DSM 3132 / Mol) TaxID=1123286 RepID=A0ABZ3J4J9_SPOA4|nr:farnesyl diphosphate synthase [Sporomusa acidovorans]OZC20362.1 farnesyl diphosphate synthase [Sporomusa acidovorans DSM 3132]SDD36546.1 geranylgeranyl diphosphate synthase, type II [Sporomusa acidovorans]
MSVDELKQYCQQKIELIDTELSRYIPTDAYPPVIYEAMRYSLFAGGKRLRPIMLMAAADAVGGKGSDYLPVACGLEMIHTYSLIHDDLPAMDNDDYRRGKLTNHKVFGDGIAVLAGDGLLTAAFEVILSQTQVEPQVLSQVGREIASAAGAAGMVGGQAIDLISEGQHIDAQTLQYLHQAKTGALFKAALRSGALLAGGSQMYIDALTNYASHFGLAFQITDDILDVVGTQEKLGKPVGSDEKNHKVTYVTLHTLEGAKQLARQAVDEAINSLRIFGSEADILRELVKHLINREA